MGAESFRPLRASYGYADRGSAPDLEVFMIVALIVCAAILLCMCTLFLLRKRSKARG